MRIRSTAADSHTHANPNSYAQTDANAHANAHANTNANPHSHSHSYSYSYTDGMCHGQWRSGIFAHSIRHANENVYGDIRRYSQRNWNDQ